MIYDAIIIKELPSLYSNFTDDYCILWISNFYDSLKISFCTSFGNKNIIKLLKILDLNSLCRFNIFYQYLNEISIQRLNKFQNILTNYNIDWHFITKEELYSLDEIDTDGQLKWNKYSAKHICSVNDGKLINICILDNKSLEKMNFKIEELFTDLPYTLLYIFNADKKYIKCLSFSSKFDFLEFNDFVNKINRDVNDNYEDNL